MTWCLHQNAFEYVQIKNININNHNDKLLLYYYYCFYYDQYHHDIETAIRIELVTAMQKAIWNFNL